MSSSVSVCVSAELGIFCVCYFMDSGLALTFKETESERQRPQYWKPGGTHGTGLVLYLLS